MSDNVIARNTIEVAVEGRGVKAGISEIDHSIKGLTQSISNAGKNASKGLGEIGTGGNKAASSVDKTTKQIINSIQRQTAAFQAGKKGTAEYYQSIAALKGANLDALKPYISQLKDAQTQADKLALANGKVTSSLGGMASSLSITKNLIGGIAASIAAVSFVGLAKGALDYADSVNDVAKANEVAIGSVLKLGNALQLNGGQSESASKLFSSLTSKLDEAAEGSEKAQKQFALVGISLKDLKTLDGQALFEKTLQGLAAIEDPIKRNATAMDLFGKAAKGVDIKGLASDYANNQQNFSDAEVKFKQIADAMDKVDAATGRLKLNIATNLAPWYASTIDYLDKLIFGWAKLEEQIRKAGGSSEGAFKAAPKITDKPALGMFNLPKEYQGDVREVIDANAAEVKKASDAAAKAQQDAIKKAKEARDKSNAEILKDIQFQIGFEQDLLEAKNQTELNAIKELQKQKEDAYKKDLERVSKLQELANKNFEEAQKESQRLEDDRLKEFEKSMDGINQVFREGFANMVNGGKGTWKSFTQSLVTTFKTTVADTIYKMLAQPFVVKIVASLLGVSASGVASAAGGSAINSLTSGDSIFKTVTDGLQSLNTNIVGSIEKLGTFLSNGNGGLADTIGGYLGQNASTIAGALAFAPSIMSLLKGDIKSAAFQGAGAGIGLALGGPVGGAIGSFLGGAIGNLFGGGTPKLPRYYTVVSSSVKNGVLTNGKGVTGSDSKGVLPGTEEPLQQLNTAFAAALGGLLRSAGKQAEIAISSTIYKKNNSFGRFDFNVNGKQTNFYNEGKSDVNATFQTLVNTVLTSVLVNAIQSSDLDSGIKKLFDGLADKTQISNMVIASVALYDAQQQLNDVYGLTVNQAAQVSKATGLAGNDLSSFALKLAQTVSGFKTIGDILVDTKSKLQSQLSTALPSNLKDYDLALKSIDKSTQAGIESFLKMYSLRDQFVAFTQSLDAVKSNVKGALLGIMSDTERQKILQADLAKAFDDLGIAMPTSIEELIKLGQSIDFTTKQGIDLASVFPSLVSAFKETQSAVDDLMNSLRDVNEFKTIIDFNRYKGLANNYGTSFANKYVNGQLVTAQNSINTPVNTQAVAASNNTTISTSDPNLLEAIMSLTAKVEALQASATSTATHSKRAADVLVNVSPNGNAIQTEVYVP